MWGSNNGTLTTRCVGERGTFGIISSNNGKSLFFQKSVSNISSPFWREPLQRGKRTNSEHRVWVSITEQISTWKLDHKGQAVHRVSMTQTTGELGKIHQPAIWFINHLSDLHFTLKEAWTYHWMLCTAIHGMSHHINDMTIYLRLPYMTLFPIKKISIVRVPIIISMSLIQIFSSTHAFFGSNFSYIGWISHHIAIHSKLSHISKINSRTPHSVFTLSPLFPFLHLTAFFSSIGVQNIMAVSVLKLTTYK